MNLLPWIISREILNDGKLGSGAKIYTFESSTNTPKATYKKADGSEFNTNPIICDASGAFVCFLGTGAYRILVTDADDIQIMPAIDGIISDSSSINSTATTASVQTYNELRALTTTPDYVYVCGRSAIGDGGQGLFQLLPTSSLIDDDCIVLTAQSGSAIYKRLFDAVIDPLWSGLVYGVSIDQKLTLDALGALSVSYGVPVLFTDAVFINQNITIPAGAQFDCSDNGYFNSTLSTTMTFAADSKFIATGRSFGITVRPIFQGANIDSIKVSHMAGTTDDDRLNKLLSSSTQAEQILEIDETLNIATTSYSTLATIKFTNQAYLNFSNSAALTLSFPRITNGPDRIFSIPTATSITSLNFGKTNAYPEWFGALGDNSNDDSFAFWQSTLGGYTFVTTGKIYWLKTGTTTPGWPSAFRITGEGTVRLGNNRTLGNGQLWIYNATVVVDNSTLWFNGSWLKAISALFPSNYTATSSLIDGCVYTDKNKYPVYDGQPSIYNAHLPLLPSCQLLGTDVTSKIVSAGPDLTLRNVSITSLTLTSATVDSLKPNKFAPIIATPTGTSATLSPAYSYNLIDNSAGQKDVILPSDPTAVYFKLIGKTGSNNIRVGCTGADTFYTGATTFTINGTGVGVASMELFRVGLIWYPVFSQL